MTSESGDPLNGGLRTLEAEDGSDFEDLPTDQHTNDTPSVQMTDLEQDISSRRPSSKDNTSRDVKLEEIDTDFLWKAIQEHCIELTDSEDSSDEENAPKQHFLGPQNNCSAYGPVTNVRIKQELGGVEPLFSHFTQGEIIDLSDSEQSPKSQAEGLYKHGVTLDDGTIMLSDGEDEEEIIILNDDGSSSVTIKKENPDVEFLGANKGLNTLSNAFNEETTRAPLRKNGKPYLRTANPRALRTPEDLEKLRKLQQMYRQKALGKAAASGASNLFNISRVAGNVQDKDAWMKGTYTPKENTADHFAGLKRAYKAKVKARKNTLEDDINFQRAEKEEKARLKRVELAYLRDLGYHSSDDDEAEESDDGLFVPQYPRENGPPKRRAPTMRDDDNNSENDAAPKGKSRPRKRRSKDASKRTPAELKRELTNNMMAGFEAEFAKMNKTADGLSRAPRKPLRGDKGPCVSDMAQDTVGTRKGKNAGEGSRPKPTQAGYMNDAASLMTSNVYEDANANIGKAAMPVMTDTRKRKAMASLISSIPVEDKAKAASEKEHILRMTTVLGSCKASTKAVGWDLKGMTSTLRHHQVQGAGTMKEREMSDSEPKGGLLADEMGFGKTVMMIATIIANPPAPDEEYRSTLIVCSPALLSQWDNEIAKHTTPNVFKNDIIRYHSNMKISSKGASGRGAVRKLQQADIVLTTYAEIVKSYPKFEIPEDIKEPEARQQWWSKHWEVNRDLLHKAHFYRVVLDEAQVIKNHRSQTSIACRGLMAKHRWAISATPILNEIPELYPYFKFLRVPHTGSYAIFKQNFCIPGSNVCNQRLHSFLDQILIRRTYKSQLFELPIIEMPATHQETITLEFNPVERKIYDIIHGRFIRAINKASADGNLEKRGRLVLSMLLRLRQMTGHIFMLQETMERLFKLEDVEEIWQVTSSEVTADPGSSRDMMKSMRKMIEVKDDPEDSIADDEDDEDENDTEQGAKLIFKFRKYIRHLRASSKWEEVKDRSTCHKCREPPDDPWITSCMHIYCSECLRIMAYEAAANDEDQATCQAEGCGEVFNESQPCGGLQELDFEEPSAPRNVEGEPKIRPKRRVKDNMKWVDFDGQILPSTKTAAVQAQIEEWLREEPTKKIIVFSQFHLLMEVLGKVCERQGWKYCKYHGHMSFKAREESIEQFRNDPEKIIMIASLKCGGIGLNLTMASRVICVDLWFNSLVEQQAFCRVFRIGQTEETYLTRFVIKNTVDERLLKMQRRKDKIIEAAMDDRSVLSTLTIEDMLRLFGDVVHDQNSRPFIFTEEDPEIASMMPPASTEEEDTVAWDV